MANINSPVDPVNEMRHERLTKLGTADNNAAPGTTTDESQTDENCFASGKPFHAGNTNIISVSPQKGYSSFAYPQIAKTRTPQERGFNQYVLKFIAADLKDYRACIRKKECEDEYSYSESYVTPEFVSINFGHWFVAGGGPRYFDTLLNYDLKAGRPVKKLADLFKPKSKYLKVISEYVDSELRRCDYSPDGFEQFSWNRTKRQLADYDGWQLTGDGVEIILPSDRIGQIGYDLGVLIPYGRLGDGLRHDVEWFTRLQGNNDVQRLSK